jgi:hypothetical protein
MQSIGTHQTKTKTGFTQTITRYQATNCNGCPLRGAYHKSKGNGNRSQPQHQSIQ